MRAGLIALVLGVGVAGCVGGKQQFVSDGPGPSPRTSVLLSSPIGSLAHTQRAALAACPPQTTWSRCHAVEDLHTSPATWSTVLDRNLECSPDDGPYKDNHAACRALITLVDGLRAQRVHVCSCPMQFGPGFTIEGRYQLKDVRLTFTGCSLCGAPKRVGAAFGVLFPT